MNVLDSLQLNTYSELEDSGATLGSIEIYDDRAWLWHVGDSRGYWIEDGRVGAIDSGADARKSATERRRIEFECKIDV